MSLAFFLLLLPLSSGFPFFPVISQDMPNDTCYEIIAKVAGASKYTITM